MAGELGEWIEQQRKARGMTKRALAEAMGISESYLSKIISGRNPALNPDVRRKIAQGLGMTLTELEAALMSLPPPPKWNATQKAIMRDPDLSQDQRGLLLALYDQLRRSPGGSAESRSS